MLDKLKKELKKKILSARRRSVLSKALVFAAQNKDTIVLVLDPKRDDIIAAHGKFYSAVNIRSKILGLKVGVISNLIKGKDVEENINRILQVMDGFLFHLAKQVSQKKVVDDKDNNLNLCQKENPHLNQPKNQPQSQNQKPENQQQVSLPQTENLSEHTAKKFTAKTILHWLSSLLGKSPAGK